MDYKIHINYNRSNAKKYSWDPTWFGAEEFDKNLIENIKEWQVSYGLNPDGLVGPMTYRRKWTEREAAISDYEPPTYCPKAYNYIVHNSHFLPIEWNKVVLWDEIGGLKIKPGRYNNNSGNTEREPKMFVNHWDVCLNAKTCTKILNKRGISVHFCLDNDGTIYQILDTQHTAWHCSSRQGNKDSIGIEISNAYYPKYQDWYVKHGFGERPMVENATVHGQTLEPFTGFYPVQIEALQALWKALNEGLGIPLKCPVDSNGKLITTVHPPCLRSGFSGFVNHYNFTNSKIDCAGLDLVKLLATT
jgi:hypothetical protein